MYLQTVENFYKKVFYFHRETGCRLTEPYYGELDGDWLIIPAKFTKAKVEKEIFLTDELKSIWYQMSTELEAWNNKGYQTVNFTGKVSKTFLFAMRELNIKHRFHDLRHTFAVRRYLQTGDIFRVKKELGHTSVTTTERYAKFSIRRLQHDFPSILHNKNSSKSSIFGFRDTFYRDTNMILPSV